MSEAELQLRASGASPTPSQSSNCTLSSPSPTPGFAAGDASPHADPQPGAASPASAMGSFPDAAAAPEVPADPLSFLVQSRTNANASSVNRLVIELLADEGFALVGPAEAPKSRLTLHHKRRRDEKCAVCAQSEAASTFCAVCGCAVCLKKITTVALHCPDCSERFHVACFGSATECPGCVLVNQSCRSPSPPSREEEAACVAYMSESKFDPAKELAFRRLLQSAATPALARVFKALQHARNALLDELRASAGGGGAQASTHARGDIAL